MARFFYIMISLLFLLSCGVVGKKSAPLTVPAKKSGDTAAATGDDEETQTFPDPENPGVAENKNKGGKKGGNADGTTTSGGNGGGGASNCNAAWEDGYWKTWPKGGSKPALPASGPAPADSCPSETPIDTTGGSTNGKSAGSQRVLLKTADEGCYVPNGGGPSGVLLGACTGLTWKVPY